MVLSASITKKHPTPNLPVGLQGRREREFCGALCAFSKCHLLNRSRGLPEMEKPVLCSLLLQKVLLSQVFDPKWTELVLERAQSVCKLPFSVQTGISWKPVSLLSNRPPHEAQNGVWVPGSSCAGSADGASRCQQLLTTTAGNGLKAADLHRTDFGSLCASGMFSGAGAPASRAAGGRSVPPQLRAGAGN